jgi:hypothetical protein
MKTRKIRLRKKQQSFETDVWNLFATVIGELSPSGEKSFRLGMELKEKHPMAGDALQVFGILLAYSSR